MCGTMYSQGTAGALRKQNFGGESVFEPNSAAEISRETYNAWKYYWLPKGRTLDDAVEYGRIQGGEAYANQLKRLIEQMEASETALA